MNETPFASPQEIEQGSDITSYNHTPVNWTFSPVTVTGKETGGVFFLGIIAVTLMIALLRALGRSHALEVQLAQRPPVA